MSQNKCAEEMLTIAARKCELPQISFNNNAKNDHQIPLNAPLLVPDHCIFSKDRGHFKNFIEGLDKNHSYILRTGQNSGAGHWSLLQFLPNQGWQLYSTSSNNCMLTNRNNVLIEDGVYSLLGNPNGTAKWGNDLSNYSINIWTVTPEKVINCTNFICGFRSSDSTNPDVCEDAGRKLMDACQGRLVDNHPYLNMARPAAAPSADTMEKFNSDLDLAFLLIGSPGGTEIALEMIQMALINLKNRADGEAEILRRMAPQFDAANGNKTILNALASIQRMCASGPELKVTVTQQSTLDDLDGLLDLFFSPQYRRDSEALKERVIECLMNMHAPREGAALILKRIEKHIEATNDPQYKATLEDIQELVQSIGYPRPR